MLGSQAVAKDYEARGVNVIAMSQVSRSYVFGYQSNLSIFKLQFDMTAWVKEGTREEVGIITDFVDPEYVIATFSQRVFKSTLDPGSLL